MIVTAGTAFAQASLPYTDVPYVATPDNVVNAMLDLAALTPNDVLVDLGSGDGRIVIAAAKRGVRAIGVEINPALIQQSQEQARFDGVSDRATFVQEDLFSYDLRAASVVTIFLTPGVNLRLRDKLLSELKPGARLVSHRFDMGFWTPSKTIAIGEDRIFLWVIAQGKSMQSSTAAPEASLPFEKLASAFSYDPSIPLNPRMDAPRQAEGCLVTGLSYVGARGPVSATLITPSHKGRYSAVIFVHDYGRRDEFLPEALALAHAEPPMISLLIDGPADRPIGWRRAFNALSDDDNDRDIHIQAVIDIRRGLDLLAARGDVDPHRIAFVGHGYGANWGAILSAVEPRLSAFVLMAGFPSFSGIMQSDDPDWANVRNALGQERFNRYSASISAVDPIRFTGHWAGAPILFQFGNFDPFVSREMAERLANSFPTPQRKVFYDAGHSVNDLHSLLDRSRFLAKLNSPKR